LISQGGRFPHYSHSEKDGSELSEENRGGQDSFEQPVTACGSVSHS